MKAGDCEIWWARTVDARPELAVLLPHSERSRMHRYQRSDDRNRFLSAWALARTVLGLELGISPCEIPVDRTCARCGKDHGKPRIAVDERVELSLSHSLDRVLVAVSHGQAVGVDLEAVIPLEDRLANQITSDSEWREYQRLSANKRSLALLRTWVRKEAVVKATGKGLLLPMTAFALTGTARPRLVGRTANVDALDRVSIQDIPCGSDYMAALATIGPLEEVAEHDGTALLSRLP
jgi:4'-phosphopantetheinyl transferase